MNIAKWKAVLMKRYYLLLLCLPACLLLFSSNSPEREKVLSGMIVSGLQHLHYQPPKLDDTFSQRCFDQFVKQLDFTKSFLLQSDVTELQKYRDRVDNLLDDGSTELAAAGEKILKKRITEVRELSAALFHTPFDFSKSETLETDGDKRAFCATTAELQELWRKRFKFMALTRYIELQKAQEKEKQNPPSPAAAGQAKDGERLTGLSLQQLAAKAQATVEKNMMRTFDRLLQEDTTDSLSRFFNAVTSVVDPHSNYFPPKDKEDFDIDMSGLLQGIGALLGEENGYVKIVEIIPGGPAWMDNKLQAEDLILKVAQGNEEPVDIVGMRVTDAVKLIRGKKGTEVRLTVKKPDGRIQTIPLVRNVVVIQETYARSEVIVNEKTGKRLGYIFLPKFYHDFQRRDGRNATDDVRAEIEKLKAQKVSGIILDLRNNVGGALNDAVRLTGLFIDQGAVVQVKDREGKIQVLDDRTPGTSWDGPLAVMINSFSASASEILAAALQDAHRAVVIGSNSFGKGTVQAMVELDDYLRPDWQSLKPLGAITITTQKFYRINGGSTQYRGVQPDIVLPDANGFLEVGERFLDFPLPFDTIAGAKLPTGPTLPAAEQQRLVEESRKRVAASRLFQEIARNTERLKKERDLTLENLQLDTFREEQERLHREAEAFNALLKEFPHLKILDSPVYDKAAADTKDPEAKKRIDWHKALLKDPYLEETTAIVSEMVK